MTDIRQAGVLSSSGASHRDVVRRERRPALDGRPAQCALGLAGIRVLAGKLARELHDGLGVRYHDPEDDDGARVDLAAGAADGGDAVDLGDEDRRGAARCEIRERGLVGDRSRLRLAVT